MNRFYNNSHKTNKLQGTANKNTNLLSSKNFLNKLNISRQVIVS
jgi:hypothetical protein